MAQPLRFAQLVQNQLYPLAQACYDGWMEEKAQHMNALELLKAIKKGEVDPKNVIVSDDGFEVIEPPEVSDEKPARKR